MNKDEIYRRIKKYEKRNCLALDGKHFPVKKMVIAQNAPPIHPRYRCSISAYMDRAEFDKWLDFMDKGDTTEEWNRLKKKKSIPQIKRCWFENL